MKTSNRFHLRPNKRKNPKGKSPMALLAVPSEAKEQEKLNEMISIKYPELIYRVGMEAGRRNPTFAKQQGLTSGWPDLHFPLPKGNFHSFWIELKKRDANLFKKDRTPIDERTRNQLKIWKYLNDHGHCAAFAFGADQAFAFLELYLNERPVPFTNGIYSEMVER